MIFHHEVIEPRGQVLFCRVQSDDGDFWGNQESEGRPPKSRTSANINTQARIDHIPTMGSECMKCICYKIKGEKLPAMSMSAEHHVIVLGNFFRPKGLMSQEDGDAFYGDFGDFKASVPGFVHGVGILLVVLLVDWRDLGECLWEPACGIVRAHDSEPGADFNEGLFDSPAEEDECRLLVGVA